MTLGNWFDLAIWGCGYLAGASSLALAAELRRTMPTGLPAALVTEGDETQRGTNLTKTDKPSRKAGDAHAR